MRASYNRQDIPLRYVITCPKCGRKTPVAKERCTHCGDKIDEGFVDEAIRGMMVPCEYCGEAIMPYVRKCRFCGEWTHIKFDQDKGTSTARAFSKGTKEYWYSEFKFELKLVIWFVFVIISAGIIGESSVGSVEFVIWFIISVVSFFWVLVRASEEFYEE